MIDIRQPYQNPGRAALVEIDDGSLLVDLRAARREVARTSRFDFDGQRAALPRDEFLIFGLTHVGGGMVTVREPVEVTSKVGPGQAYFLRRPGPYRLWHPGEDRKPWEFTFVAVRFYRPNDFAWKLAKEYSPVMDVRDDDALAVCVERLAEVFELPDVRNNRFTRSALAYRFLMAVSAHRESREQRHLSPAMEHAVAYIDDHLADDLGLTDIARVMKCSEDTVIRRFRRELGTTFVTHMTERRFRRAKRLLVTSDLPIKAVAAEAGFHSASYFCSVFGRMAGVTPATYRGTADLCDPDLT